MSLHCIFKTNDHKIKNLKKRVQKSAVLGCRWYDCLFFRYVGLPVISWNADNSALEQVSIPAHTISSSRYKVKKILVDKLHIESTPWFIALYKLTQLMHLPKFCEFLLFIRVLKKVSSYSLLQHCVTRCAFYIFRYILSDATFFLWQICADICAFKIAKLSLSQSREKVTTSSRVF